MQSNNKAFWDRGSTCSFEASRNVRSNGIDEKILRSVDAASFDMCVSSCVRALVCVSVERKDRAGVDALKYVHKELSEN